MNHAIKLTALCTALGLPVSGHSTAVFVNELHYDNSGTDTGEFIEIAGPAGVDLTGWQIELYNGNGGSLYRTTPLAGLIPDAGNGFGFVVQNYPTNGIQNGSPDGIALVNNGTPVQFLSYEGSFTAVGGSANGLTSTDIGVAESSGTPIGFSLQLGGSGSKYDDFTWQSPALATDGLSNTGQTFVQVPPSAVVINEVRPNPPGLDPATQSVELSGNPGDSFDGVLVSIESDAIGSLGSVDSVSAVSGTFDANGLLVATIPDLENPSFTLALLDNFFGTTGTDLDTDNDGTLDNTGSLGTVLDAVGVPDSVTDEITLYATELGGQDLAFIGSEPQLIFRERSSGGWHAVDFLGDVFDINANGVAAGAFDRDPTVPTFGAENPALAAASVPEPASLALLGLGLAGIGYRRRGKTRGRMI